MLKAAGFPNGINLNYVFRNKGKAPAIAATMQAELKKSGINLKLKQVNPADFYTQHLSHLPAIKSGDWDIAVPGWSPDWAGNAARSFFVPLLDGRLFAEGTTNYGGYNNPAVNALPTRHSPPAPEKAAELWAQVDKKTMEDAPWVPIDYGKSFVTTRRPSAAARSSCSPTTATTRTSGRSSTNALRPGRPRGMPRGRRGPHASPHGSDSPPARPEAALSRQARCARIPPSSSPVRPTRHEVTWLCSR